MGAFGREVAPEDDGKSDNIRYDELHKVCCEHFGTPRQEGSSHAVFKTPWAGDSRVNIQREDGGKAKTYQVTHALAAIERLEQTQ